MAPITSHTVKVILLSGRSGSGKSRTAYEAAHILLQQKVMHASIEADNLDTMFPRRNGNPATMLDNLKAVWTNYWQRACMEWSSSSIYANRDSAFITLINGTAIVVQVEKIEAIIQDVVSSNCELICFSDVKVEFCLVILKSSEATVTQRLTEREIGGELERHLISTRKMDHTLEEWSNRQTRPISSVLSEGRNVHQVAIDVLQIAGIALEE